MAKAKLDEIIDALSPDTIGRKVRKKHQRAFVSYGLKDIEVPDYESFRQHLIKYVQHHYKTTHDGVGMPEEEAFHLAQELLNANREGGGFKGAFERARNGQLADVLFELSKGMEETHVEAYTAHNIGKIDPFDFEEHKEIAEKLSGMYKPLIKETKPPEELAHQYEGLIRQHGNLVRGIKSIYAPYKPKKKDLRLEKAA